MTILVAALLVASSCASLPRPGKPAMADVQFRMREFRLANGMRIIVEEDHASPLVGVFTVVGVGSAGDPQGKEGLAHLLEHLAFRATPGGGLTAWSQLESAGVGFLNASTDLDSTMYFEVGAKDLLPTLLAIDAARLSNPLFGVDQKTFEVEREVVRNELRQRGENAIGPAFNFLQEAAFPPGHRYARPIGGSHESLSSITLDDAKAFAAKHYQPANMTMVIIGDVDLTRVQEDLFRGLPAGFFQPLPQSKDAYPSRLAAQAPPLPEPPPQRLIKRYSTVASPELYVVWSLPRSFEAETVLLDFVRAAASRELQAAFFSDPDIVGVNVFTVPAAEASMLVAQATLRRGDHVEKSYEKLLDQLVNIWATTEYAGDANVLMAADKAFGRSRNAAVMQMTLDAENIASRGAERAMSTHFTGDPLTYSRRLKALIDINEARVTHFAEAYLKRERARAVLVEPFPPDAKEAAVGPTGLSPASGNALPTVIPPESVKALGKSQQAHAMETIVRASADHLEETLPNGLRVIVQRRRNAMPVAVVQLTFPHGSGTAEPFGAADLGLQIASPRGRKYGHPGDYGIQWDVNVTASVSTVTGSGASGNVDNMLAQLSERVTSMHVETADAEYFKTEFADYLEKTEQLPQVRAERALRSALFAGHPFGRTATVAEQRGLSAGEVESWFDRAWSPRGAVLVVAGDVNAEQTLAAVKRWLGDWTPGGKPLPDAPPVPVRSDSRPEVLVTAQPNATQAQLHLACLARGATEAEELANDTTARLLGATLFDKIRGELGASYGIHGSSSTLLGGTSRLDWTGAIENGRLAQALKVLKATTADFEKVALTDAAIGRARWEVAREATMENSSTDVVAAVLSHRALLGRSTDGVATQFDVLASLGRAELEATWRQCKGSTVLSLTGDEALIRQALKDAGY
ncbi:MAG: insulinase family protein [Myxococcota bacterium]